MVIDTLDSGWAGYYFDLRQATSEGGVSGWKIAMNLVMPQLKMLSVKGSSANDRRIGQVVIKFLC